LIAANAAARFLGSPEVVASLQETAMNANTPGPASILMSPWSATRNVQFPELGPNVAWIAENGRLRLEDQCPLLCPDPEVGARGCVGDGYETDDS
jgi:hypothetical protein